MGRTPDRASATFSNVHPEESATPSTDASVGSVEPGGLGAEGSSLMTEVQQLLEHVWGGGQADSSRTPSSVLAEGPIDCTVREHELPSAARPEALPVLLVPPMGSPAACMDRRRDHSLAGFLVQSGKADVLARLWLRKHAVDQESLGLEHWIDEVVPTAIRDVLRGQQRTTRPARGVVSRRIRPTSRRRAHHEFRSPSSPVSRVRSTSHTRPRLSRFDSWSRRPVGRSPPRSCASSVVFRGPWVGWVSNCWVSASAGDEAARSDSGEGQSGSALSRWRLWTPWTTRCRPCRDEARCRCTTCSSCPIASARGRFASLMIGTNHLLMSLCLS